MKKFNPDYTNSVLKRSWITLGLIILLRLGSFLPVPGVNQNDLAFYLETHSTTRNFLSTFSVNSQVVVGLFTLNIFPYINATIFTQVLLKIVPQLSELQNQGDLNSRRFIARLIRVITLFFAIFQATTIAFYLKPVLLNWSYPLVFNMITWLTTGAMIVLWLSELITEYGLGNGTSIFIFTNILSNLPSLMQKVILEVTEKLPTLSQLALLIIIITSLFGIAFLQETVRVIPLISSRQLNQKLLTNDIVKKSFLPLRLNQAGVMPIILSTAFLAGPNYLLANSRGFYLPESVGILYWIIYFLLIVISSSYYSNLVLNAKDISNQLQKMAVAIPGIRPGSATTFYLQNTMDRVNTVGAILLGLLVVIPGFIVSKLHINSLHGIGISSFLILAGVSFDLSRELSNLYYANKYNNQY